MGRLGKSPKNASDLRREIFLKMEYSIKLCSLFGNTAGKTWLSYNNKHVRDPEPKFRVLKAKASIFQRKWT
jgi:hypothetical protein